MAMTKPETDASPVNITYTLQLIDYQKQTLRLALKRDFWVTTQRLSL
jgi:hypothetical protein